VLVLIRHAAADLELLAIATLMLLPGWAVAIWARIRARIGAELVPALAITVALAILVPVTAVALALRTSPRILAFAWAGLCLLSALLLVALLVRSRERERSSAGRSRRARFSGIAIAAAAIGSVFAWVVRANLAEGGDTPYHAALALKLERLPHPSFSNTNAFADGSAHPGYFVPAYHEFLAITARFAHVAPIHLIDVLPALLFPVFVLTWAGICRMTFGSAAGAAAGAIAALLGTTLVTGTFVTIGTISQPRAVTSAIMLPLAVGLALQALRDPSGIRICAALLAVDAIASTVVHVTYLPLLVLILAAVVAAAAIDRSRLEGVARNAGIVIGAVLVPGAVAAGVLALAVSSLHLHVLPTDSLAASRLIGSAASHTQRLRLQYLFDNGFQLLGLVGCALIAWRRRILPPGAAWAAILVAVTVLLAGVPFLYFLVEKVMSAGQAERLWILVPWPVGVAALLLAIVELFRRPLRRATVAVVACCALTFTLGWGLLIDTRFTNPARAHGSVYAVIAWLAVAAIAFALARPLSFARSAGDAVTGRGVWRSGVAALAASLCALALVVPPFAAHGLSALRSDIAHGFLEKPPLWPPNLSFADRLIDPSSADGFYVFAHGGVAAAITHIPPGSVIIGRSLIVYKAMALAPAYAVAQDHHIARTRANRVNQRLAILDRFLDPATSDAERLGILRRQHVTWLLLQPSEDPSLKAFVLRNRRYFVRQAHNRQVELWSVNVSKLGA
jgi:hypothetical protein